MKDSLGCRIKSYYEDRSRYYLPMRMPVILRVDGKAFHTYTRGLNQPWSDELSNLMDEVAIRLCHDIQGAEIAYVQSDEISILIHNYKRLESQAWFDNNVQKMCSIAAGIASAYFTLGSWKLWSSPDVGNPTIYKMAVFDARVFVLPESEVCNYFIWRQQDATRNAVQTLARSEFSHKECENKNSSELQEMLFTGKGINFNDISTYYKRGRCIRRSSYIHSQTTKGTNVARPAWEVDRNIPIFTQNREYIDDLLAVED